MIERTAHSKVPASVVEEVTDEARSQGAVMTRSGRTRSPPRPRHAPAPPSRLRYLNSHPTISIRVSSGTKARLVAKAHGEGTSLTGWLARRIVEEMDSQDAAYAKGRSDGKRDGYAAGYLDGRSKGFERGKEQASSMSHEEGVAQGRELGNLTGLFAGMLVAGFRHNDRPWKEFDLVGLIRLVVSRPEIVSGVRAILAQNGLGQRFVELLRAAQGPSG